MIYKVIPGNSQVQPVYSVQYNYSLSLELLLIQHLLESYYLESLLQQ